MNGLYVDEIKSWEKTLPTYIEECIFCPDGINAVFSPSSEEAKYNLYADPEKVRRYIGTYFPRSFCESANVHAVLLGLDPVLRAWKKKSTITILDIGAGTGGNLAGLLHALFSLGLTPRVRVYAVDGNDHASAKRQIIVSEVAGSLGFNLEMHSISKTFSLDPGLFEVELRQILDEISEQLDLVMAWKSVSELFVSDPGQSSGYYEAFVRTCVPLLEASGFVSLLDVTIKHGGRWLPTLITSELKSVLKSLPHVGLCLPFGCAQRVGGCPVGGCYPKFCYPVSHLQRSTDKTKFTYFALGTKAMAGAICAGLPDNVPCQELCGREDQIFHCVPRLLEGF